MKKLYSIGETSKITGVSIQTLRNYSNDALLEPAYINKETGYRYFSFEQFHIIDRIKYLRSLDVPLPEIREILSSNHIEDIVLYLEKQSAAIDEQIDTLKRKKHRLDWYSDYFKYYSSNTHNMLPHVSHFGPRSILATDCELPLNIENIEIRLTALKTAYSNKGFSYLRQFGYLLPYASIMAQKWEPEKHFIYFSQIPSNYDLEEDEHVITLPEGDYFCCSFHLRHLEELNIPLLQSYFENQPTPSFVIANEYEDNLHDFRYCPYELQFLLH